MNLRLQQQLVIAPAALGHLTVLGSLMAVVHCAGAGTAELEATLLHSQGLICRSCCQGGVGPLHAVGVFWGTGCTDIEQLRCRLHFPAVVI